MAKNNTQAEESFRLDPYSPDYPPLSGDSAVRWLNPEERIEEERRLRRREERRRRWEEQIRERAIETEYAAIRDRSSLLSRAEAFIIASLAVLLLGAGAFYLRQLSAEASSSRALEKAEKEYAQLVEDNKALNSQIEGSIDHERIYQYVTQELGMHYPASTQVIEYTASNAGRLVEEEEIPE